MTEITTAELFTRLAEWSRRVQGEGDNVDALTGSIKRDLEFIEQSHGLWNDSGWVSIALDALDGLTRNMIAMKGDDGTRDEQIGRAILSFVMLANEGQVQPDGKLADHLHAMLTCAHARNDREAMRAIRPMLDELPRHSPERRHGTWAVIALTAIGRAMVIMTSTGGDTATRCAVMMADRIEEMTTAQGVRHE